MLKGPAALQHDQPFLQKKNNLIFRVLVISSIVIFAIETFLMVFLEFHLLLAEPVVVVLDGLVLIILLFPINYFFIVRPLSRQIDEHYHTSQELMKSNEVLERFFSISDVLIAYMDADFNFIRVNQAYADTDQRPAEEFIGKNHFALFPNEENQAIFENVVKTGKAFNIVEKPFVFAEHPERGVTYWDWSLMPVKDPSGKVIALILVLNNVTERVKAQQALVESERRFRGVFNQTFQHSLLLDSSGNVLLANQTALDFTGYAQDALAGRPLWKLPWWDTATTSPEEIQSQLQTAIQQAVGEKFVRGEYKVKARNGEKATMDITIKPLFDEQGAPAMLIYEARDITDRIKAEEALKHSESEVKRLYMAEMEAHRFAETLRSAVLAISGSLDSDTIFNTLLDHLHQVVPYTSAHILLLEDEQHFIVRLARGEEAWPEQARLMGRRLPIENIPFTQTLLKQKEMITVPDTLLYPGLWFLPEDAFVRSWLAIPLLAGEQVVGICMLEHLCPSFFNPDLVHWATALTGQAAVAMQNAWLFDQVRDGREQQQALSRRLVEVQENERHYIARELHDEAGQALASMMIGLHHLEKDSGDPQAVIEHSRELKQIAEDVLEELHRLAVDLRPASLDHLGLEAALRQHAETVAAQHGLNIQFEAVGKIERLPGEIETAIYRIAQEALTNVVRHAQASRVGILLERRDETIVIVVEDNGIGFDPQTLRSNQLGILGMHERANMLGGKVSIESAPGKGSTIVLEVPCPSES